MPLVAGIDSSTQSCKVLICDADSGEILRRGQAPHPGGTEVDPYQWWIALIAAIEQAGGLDDVSAVSIAGQQHGMVVLDETGEVVRPALLWNDTRSAKAAEDLVEELGAQVWAEQVGLVPVASFTVSKLRWFSEAEPELAKRVAAVCLPHDWLTWKLRGSKKIADLITDRSDASGTGYWSAVTNSYQEELLVRGFGRSLELPKVLQPLDSVSAESGLMFAAGLGDNAAAALGIGANQGDVVVSIGTSGVVSAVTAAPAIDPSGIVAGFADGTGKYLPLACTLNGSRIFDHYAKLFELNLDQLADVALSASSGSEGVVTIPYFQGERTPNLPQAKATISGLSLQNMTKANLIRSAYEGLLCGLADAAQSFTNILGKPNRFIFIGGAVRSKALQEIAPEIFPAPVVIPSPEEFVALGAARQAASALKGKIVQWPSRNSNTYQPISKPEITQIYKANKAAYENNLKARQS